MKRRDPYPTPRDHAQHRREWRAFAMRVLALVDAGQVEVGELRALGDQAAIARNVWSYPAPGAEGALAAALAVTALTWARQTSAEVRLRTAGGVRVWAETVLELLNIVEAEPPAHPYPARPFRADIDG